MVVGTVACAVGPADPIPESLPGLGYLDELVVLPWVALALRPVPDAVLEDCRSRADGEIDAGKARWIVTGITVLARPGMDFHSIYSSIQFNSIFSNL